MKAAGNRLFLLEQIVRLARIVDQVVELGMRRLDVLERTPPQGTQRAGSEMVVGVQALAVNFLLRPGRYRPRTSRRGGVTRQAKQRSSLKLWRAGQAKRLQNGRRHVQQAHRLENATDRGSRRD